MAVLVFPSAHNHHDPDPDHGHTSTNVINNHNDFLIQRQQVHDPDDSCSAWRLPFQIFTTLLLGLLLPLSFLLLARLSSARYLSVLGGSSAIASFLVVYTAKSIVLYALVSLVTVSALVHCLAAPILTFIPPPQPLSRRPATTLCFAWVLLCAFQVCVGLGIEGTISAGIDGSGFASQSNSIPVIIIIRALLFVGLHETMSFWSRSVVKPVVEDTVGLNGARMLVLERVGLALSLGALWWWKLREEVDALVVVPELMLAGAGASGRADVVVGVAELFGWWLYYLTVSIGTMRVLKAIIWTGIRVVPLSSAVVVACRNSIDEDQEEKTDDYDTSHYVSQSYRQLHLPLEESIV